MKKAILFVGNVIDGFVLYGPYEDSEDALAAAEVHLRNHEDWTVGYLNLPEDLEG